MCGIFCEIYCSQHSEKNNKILQRIKNRGPDCSHFVNTSITDEISAFFFGAVLWLQGLELTSQPVENDCGILLYNGDIFDEAWDKESSDTNIIMNKLSEQMTDQQIMDVLKSLKGPFSLLYYRKNTQDLYFTRDRIGRSTMLFHKNEKSIVISSVLDRKYKCVEVPATHIHVLNLINNKIRLYSWHDNIVAEEHSLSDWLELRQQTQSLPDDQFNCEFNDSLDVISEDDVVKHIEQVSREITCKYTILKNLMDNIVIGDTVMKITELLEKSVKIRLETQPKKCKECLNSKAACDHCTVGVLFSGGLDCTILALLADKYLPIEQSIDLINVAFSKGTNTSYDVPDRITGRQSFEELKKLKPNREWVFREIDVPQEELLKYQASVIGDLVYPRQTILDESLGSALWFAARGQNNDSVSPCRILLLGSGADELFGGYTRHRNAFKRFGWPGLSKELQLDWQRISFRNLARDNRVICDHGRQPRMPYLDEDFTEFVLQLKPWLKCFPSEKLGIGIGDKLMLRLVALNIGLTEVVTLPKRALQFGSRIANKKEKGSDISKTFLDIY